MDNFILLHSFDNLIIFVLVVIDLSVNDANTIISRPELLHYNIPQCSFNDTLPRKKSTRQKVLV